MAKAGVAFTTKLYKSRLSNTCIVLHLGDDISYIRAKKVKNSFLLLIELIGMINIINAFVMTYLSCVVNVVDELR